MSPYCSALHKISTFSMEEKQAILKAGLLSPALQSAIDKIEDFTSEEKRAIVARGR